MFTFNACFFLHIFFSVQYEMILIIIMNKYMYNIKLLAAFFMLFSLS